MSYEFTTGQHLLAFPEIKRYVLRNTFSDECHLVTKQMLKDAFLDTYDKIMANRVNAWVVEDYFD